MMKMNKNKSRYLGRLGVKTFAEECVPTGVSFCSFKSQVESMSYHPIYDDVETIFKKAQRDYLESRGWEYTSDTPGHLWLWEKNVDGKRILVSQDIAIYMQKFIC